MKKPLGKRARKRLKKIHREIDLLVFRERLFGVQAEQEPEPTPWEQMARDAREHMRAIQAS